MKPFDYAGSAQDVNWKSRCLGLAKLVDRHRRDRMLKDKKKAWKMAKEILKEVNNAG